METVIEYGDLGVEETSLAKVNLVASKQRSGARTIAIDMNKFYFNEVAELENYGILNAPSLSSAITPAIGTSLSALWSSKTGEEIYNDFITLYKDITARSGSLLTADEPMTFTMFAECESYLGKLNSLGNHTIKDMILSYFKNAKFVSAPQMKGVSQSMLLTIDKLEGQATGKCAFSEKLIAGRIIPALSSFKKKYMAGTWGAIIYRPFLVGIMTGI